MEWANGMRWRHQLVTWPGPRRGGFLFFRRIESARIQPKSLHNAPKGVNGDAFSSPLVRTACSCRSCIEFLGAIGGPERGLAGHRSHCHHWSWVDRCGKRRRRSACKPGTAIYFQNGAVTTWEQLDKKAPSCRLSAVESPVVRRLVPGRKIIITGTRQNNASVNFLRRRS